MILASKNMGRTTATQIGNYLSGVDYNYHGLEKAVVSGYEPGSPKRIAYENAIAEISPYIKLVMPEKISKDLIGCEVTGSPKALGYKTKEEFLLYAKGKGYYHTGLKDAKVLFTDDVNSSSSKTLMARKRGVTIMLYTDI
jgi:hypothetical protein